jgi:hypothetical protein
MIKHLLVEGYLWFVVPMDSYLKINGQKIK